MSGTEATATLSLEIKTDSANASITALETRLQNLGLKTAGEPVTPKSFTSISTAAKAVEGDVKHLVSYLSGTTLKIGSQTGAFSDLRTSFNKEMVALKQDMQSQIAALNAQLSRAKLKAPSIDVSSLKAGLGEVNATLRTMSEGISQSLSTIATRDRAFSDAEPKLKALSNAHKTAAASAGEHAKSTKLFTDAQINAHSAARGLAGSLGTLWMTYGAIVPLMAGAALGAGFKEAAKAGSEFAYQLTFVKALGGESAEAVAGIGAAALSLSKTSMYGPVELANGLRILSQAGLNAAQSMEALPTAMNLATVGEMNMEQASLTLIGVMNAFGMSMNELPHIGDMFAKAAALSQTSVAGMTEAMKTASVVHDQYGASIEDTATAIALLAKVNITGTAAGTSYRNMLKDLYTPSKKATDTMEQLGIKTRDANGNLREAPEIMKDLHKQLQRFSSGSQTEILGKIFSERGGKEAIQMLNAVGGAWDELKDKIANSDGFMQEVTSEMEMTTKGRFQQALNTMQVSLVKAFESSEGSVRGLADSLRSFADSAVFTTALNGVVGIMGTLGSTLAYLAPAIVVATEAWVAFKAVMLLSSGITAVSTTLAGISTALTVVKAEAALAGGGLTGLRAGLEATSSAAGVASGAKGLGGVASVLAVLTSPAGALAAAIAATGTLWYVMSQGMAASDSAVKGANNFIDVLDRSISKIEKEVVALKERNRLMREGVDPSDEGASNLNASQAEQKRLEKEIAKRKSALSSGSLNSYANRDERQMDNGGLAALEKALADVTSKTETLSKAATAKLEESTGNFILSSRAEIAKFDQGAAAAVKAARNARDKQKLASIDAASASLKTFLRDVEIKGVQSGKDLREVQETYKKLVDAANLSLIGSGKETFTPIKKDGAAEADKETDAIKKLYEATKLVNAQAYEKLRAAELGEVADSNAIKAGHEILQVTNAKAAAGKNLTAQDLKYLEQTRQLAVEADEHAEAEKKLTEALNERRKVLRSFQEGTGQINVEAGSLAEQAELMKQYGLDAKLTAIQLAELSVIEARRRGLNDSDAEQARMSAAANKQLSQSYFDLTKTTEELNKNSLDVEAEGKLMFAESEADKIRIKEEATLKIIALYQQEAEAARALILMNDSLTEAQAAQAQAAYDKAMAQSSAALAAVQQNTSKKLQAAELKDWKSTVDKIEGEFHKGFSSMFESGKDGWKEMTNSFQNMFKSTVVEYIYKAFAKPLTLNVIASASGALGFSGLSSAADSSAGGGLLSGAGDILSTGKSAFDIYSGASGLTGGFLSGMASVGSEAALGAAFVGPSATLASGSVGMGASVGSLFGTAASGLAAAIPIVGGVLAIGSLLGGLFESGERFPTTAASQTGTYKDGDFTNTGEAAYYNSSPDFGTGVDEALNRLNKQYSESLSKLMESLGEEVDIETDARVRLRRTSGALATGFYAKINGVDISQAAQYGKDGEDMAGSMEQFFNDVMSKGIIKAINATNIDDAIKGLFADLESVDNTSTMLTNVVNLATYSSELNDVWGVSIAQAAKVASSVSDSNDALISTVGAMATFAASQRSIGETLSTTLDDLTESFADLSSAEFPTTLNAYDAAMKGVNKTTEEGLKTFAELFSMREQFAAFQAAIDALKTSVTASVYDLRSPEAQLKIQQKSLSDLSAAAGISVPQSAEELIALADSIDYTTEAGINLANVLPTIVSSFNATQTAADAAAKATDAVVDSFRSIAEAAYDAADDIASALLDAAQTAMDSALSGLERAIDAEKTRLDENFTVASDALSERISSLESIDSLVKSALSQAAAPASAASYTMAQNGLALAATNMLSGILPDADALSQLIQRTSSTDSSWFASESDQMRAQARTRASLTSLSGSTDAQKTVAEQTLETLKNQYDAQTKALDAQLSAAQAQVNALYGIDDTTLSIGDSVKRLNRTMSNYGKALADKTQADLARKQLDALNGIDASVDSLADAFTALNAAIYNLAKSTGQAATPPVTTTDQPYVSAGGASYNSAGGTWTLSSGQVMTNAQAKKALADIYSTSGASGVYDAVTAHGVGINDIDKILGLTAGTAVAKTSQSITDALLAAGNVGGQEAMYYKAKKLGISLDDVDSIFRLASGTSATWAKSNGLPAFDQGINYVPYDMTAQIHKGERIFPAADNAALMQALSGGMTREDSKVIIEELRKLRESNTRDNERIDQAVSDIATLLDKAMPTRNAFDVRIAA